MDRKAHWDHLYHTVAADQASWFLAEPTVSLRLIREVAPDPAAAIIDVGGGASTLIDHLLEAGYQRLTVLDLSPTALAAARTRLGLQAGSVTWLDADVLTAPLPAAGYDVWHDRALFHFLTDPADRHRYLAQVAHAVRPGGYVIVASFGPDGPVQCSGLPVVRYSSQALHAEFGRSFRLLESVTEAHRTPAGRSQAFVYSLLEVVESARAVWSFGLA